MNIIEDFLNVTRIELGKMKYEFASINWRDLAEKVVGELRPTIEKKDLVIDFSAGEGNYIVTADAGKLSQIISNIIDNAAKYTPTGAIHVSMESLDSTLRLVVQDTGVGIPAETIPKLFEKFVRADDAGKVNYSGTGLGLYVAKQMVEAHRGKIWAESDGVGKGSRFIVELPREASRA